MKRLLPATLAAVLLAAPPAFAGAASIAAIVDGPESYVGQEVTVIGTVVEPALEHAGETLYTLVGDGRRITVIADGAAPAPGERIQVTAKVGWKAPDEEFTWPPVLLESAHQPAP